MYSIHIFILYFLISENNLECPQELEELYEMYQDIGEEMFNPPSHSNSVQNLSSYKVNDTIKQNVQSKSDLHYHGT